MKKILFAILFVSSAFAGTLPESCFNPNPAGCDFYANCLEKKITCGNKGYSIGFGKRYCDILSSINTPSSLAKGELSSAGVKWRDATRKCLQVQLFPMLTADWQISCGGLKVFAMNTHPTCYTIPGNSFCSLPMSDWKVFFSAFKDPEWGPEAFQQITRMASNCLSLMLNRKDTSSEEYNSKAGLLHNGL